MDQAALNVSLLASLCPCMSEVSVVDVVHEPPTLTPLSVTVVAFQIRPDVNEYVIFGNPMTVQPLKPVVGLTDVVIVP